MLLPVFILPFCYMLTHALAHTDCMPMCSAVGKAAVALATDVSGGRRLKRIGPPELQQLEKD